MVVYLKFILIAKKLSNDKFHLYLRVTYRRKTKLIGEGVYLQKKQWDAKKEMIVNHPNKRTLNIKIRKRKAKAQDIIDRWEIAGVGFSFDRFREMYKGEGRDDLLLNAILKKAKSSKIATAIKYRQLFQLITHYDKNIVWQDVDMKWLKGFEKFLKKRNNADTTIKTRMTNLKTVYNEYEKEYKIDVNLNPFLHYSFKVKKMGAKAVYLELQELELFIGYQPKNDDETWAKNVFLFSLYCRGMNFKDIANLKWSEVSANEIEYTRSKTSHRFLLSINSQIQQILNWTKGRGINDYVFNIINEYSLINEKTKEGRIHSQNYKMNKVLKSICKKIGVNKKLTTYSARHTFATLLKFKGVDVAVISELLGHSELKTTKHYLANFKEDNLAKEADKITEISGEARR